MHEKVAEALGIPTDHREERLVMVREVTAKGSGPEHGPYLAYEGEDPAIGAKVLVVVDRGGRVFCFLEVEHDPAPGVEELWWSPVWRLWVEVRTPEGTPPN
jgi:hypothetical protein